jgi:hypothetical protein
MLAKDEFVAGLARPVSFLQCRIPWLTAEDCYVKLCLASTCLLVQADFFVHFAIRISSIARSDRCWLQKRRRGLCKAKSWRLHLTDLKIGHYSRCCGSRQ